VPITATNPFKGRQYPGEAILQAVRWYLRYPVAHEHVAELLAERGPRSGFADRISSVRRATVSILYLLRTGCQWRLLPRDFPAWVTVYHYFRLWKNTGVRTCVQRAIYEKTRRQAGHFVPRS
jgi:transposase